MQIKTALALVAWFFVMRTAVSDHYKVVGPFATAAACRTTGAAFNTDDPRFMMPANRLAAERAAKINRKDSDAQDLAFQRILEVRKPDANGLITIQGDVMDMRAAATSCLEVLK